MVAYCSDPENKTSPFIYSINPDYRLTASNSFFDSVTGFAGANFTKYPTRLKKPQQANVARLPPTVKIPGPNVTGCRVYGKPMCNGMCYDYSDIWLFNAFRLSETSNKSVNSNKMIGFVHNEDYWDWQGAVNGCIYKSIGVRHSDYLGLSWTRSAPILTRFIQSETFAKCKRTPTAGTGDMAAMWDPLKSRWVIFGQDKQPNIWGPGLVMSVSTDPLARPGTWTRIDPTCKVPADCTDPGFIGSMNRTLLHPDFKQVMGASPSIIRDSKNKVWHMVYNKLGGGFYYSNSTNLERWTKPFKLDLITPFKGHAYPTPIGDEGDTLTTNGKVWMYFKDSKYNETEGPGYGFGAIYTAHLDFSERTP